MRKPTDERFSAFDIPPPVKRVIPFNIKIIIESIPEQIGGAWGYRHTVKGTGRVNGKPIEVKVSEFQGWSNADYLCQLKFYVAVDANVLVPLINQKNREE